MEIEKFAARFGDPGQEASWNWLDSLVFGFELEGFADSTGSIRLRYSHQGADPSTEREAPAGLFPESVALVLSLQDLPVRAMSEALEEYLTENEIPDPAADAILSAKLAELLTQAGSLLAIRTSSL